MARPSRILRVRKVREGGTPSPTHGTCALPGTLRLAALAPDGTECHPYRGCAARLPTYFTVSNQPCQTGLPISRNSHARA